MPVIPIVLSITAGICLSAGAIHLLLGLSRRPHDWVHITFALASLAIAGNALAVLAIHTADSVDAYVAAFKYAFGPTALLINVGILWFVAFYTRVRPRWFLLAMSLWFTGIIALQLVLPYGILFADISGLRSITMPWGEQFVVGQATPHPWRLAVDLFFVVFFAFLLYATYRQYRRGDRGRASLLALTILLFLPSVVFDSLVDTGVINSIYISEIVYLVFVVLMSVQLYGEVMQTESELRQYRTELEAMVDERTLELRQANEKLAREMAERMGAEQALRRSESAARALINAPPDSAFLLDAQGIILDLNQVAAVRLELSLHEAKGQDAFDLFGPQVGEARRAKFEEAIATKRPVRWQDRRATYIFDNTFYPILDDQGKVTRVAAFAADVTERVQFEEALRRRVEELAALNAIARAVTNVTGLADTLAQASEIVTDLFAAQYAHIIWSERPGGDSSVWVGYERGSGHTGLKPLRSGLSEVAAYRKVLRKARIQIVSDVQSLVLEDVQREFLVERNIQSVLLVPLAIRREVRGLLTIGSDQPGHAFNADEVRLAEIIATDLTAAIEAADRVEQAQTAAAAEERSRLARELHDSVTQILFSINLIALSLGRLWKRNPDMAARSTDELQRLTRGALAEMRTLLRELRPQTIAATELSTLLKQLSDGVSARHDIPVDLDVNQTCELPPEVHVAFYRIAQEALSNITKHAEASQVAIELVCEAAAVQLTITDDGQGFEPNDVPAECMGLDIIRERAEAVGATTMITSRPGAGTSIVVVWPIPQTEGDADAKS